MLLAPDASWAQAPITDDSGETVTLAAPAKRIIALYGAFNEILAEMGLEERIIARTRADKIPPSILEKPAIGTHMRPNVEMIVGLAPDLVLQMSGRRQALAPVEALKRFNIPTAVFKAANFEELYGVIARVGVLTGAAPAAQSLTTAMKTRLEAMLAKISAKSADSARPRVFFEVRYPNLLAAGRGSIVNDIIERAGGVNCVTSDKKLVRLSEEELVRLNPDVYLSQQGPMNPTPSDPMERSHFRTLNAIRDGRVYFIDEQMFSRPGPRNVDAVETLARLLHPDLF